MPRFLQRVVTNSASVFEKFVRGGQFFNSDPPENVPLVRFSQRISNRSCGRHRATSYRAGRQLDKTCPVKSVMCRGLLFLVSVVADLFA